MSTTVKEETQTHLLFLCINSTHWRWTM